MPNAYLWKNKKIKKPLSIKMKSQLGQFFTTNADYILYGLESFVRNKVITDPFAGNQDLFVWAIKHRCKKITGSEISI